MNKKFVISKVVEQSKTMFAMPCVIPLYRAYRDITLNSVIYYYYDIQVKLNMRGVHYLLFCVK